MSMSEREREGTYIVKGDDNVTKYWVFAFFLLSLEKIMF